MTPRPPCCRLNLVFGAISQPSSGPTIRAIKGCSKLVCKRVALHLFGNRSSHNVYTIQWRANVRLNSFGNWFENTALQSEIFLLFPEFQGPQKFVSSLKADASPLLSLPSWYFSTYTFVASFSCFVAVGNESLDSSVVTVTFFWNFDRVFTRFSA